jgi:hypothetical protein
MPEAAAFRRAPGVVMRLSRMGSAHPTRLSFLRVLLRRMTSEAWQFDRPVWQVDAKGVGRAVYRVAGPDRTYSLVAFAHDLPDDMRSDRVIATAWDATFTLFDGVPDAADLDRLQANVPLQEAGRISGKELTLARANRSVRLFAHVIDRLAQGQQPDRAEVDNVGYLMRTTAVYGAGKFGAADRAEIADRAEMGLPFQAEMLTVWLIRQFTVDLAEHLAVAKGGATAAKLDAEIRKGLGVGNSTGLGMAPFIVRHPVLLNNWMMAREEALARVRAQPAAQPKAVEGFGAALDAATENARLWRSDHAVQVAKLTDLRNDLTLIAERLKTWPENAPQPWDALWRWGETALTLEGQETLLSLMLEPHGDLVDGLACCMSADESTSFRLDGTMSTDALKGLLTRHYAWALDIDFTDAANRAQFWYVSEEKLEPRLGRRFDEAGAEREQPLCVARMAQALHNDLCGWTGLGRVAALLLAHPEHRNIVRRVQRIESHPFAEVQDNLDAADMLPIDMMRCKLAFFGASRFDPRSDKWVRINLFQGEVYPCDLAVSKTLKGAQA